MGKGFSLFDFCKNKKLERLQVFGTETLDDKGNIIPFTEQAALITHYLQLKDYITNLPYAHRAAKILNLWYSFGCENRDLLKTAVLPSVVEEPNTALQQYLFSEVYKAPFQPAEHHKFTFIDLFAGIGGFRLAMQAHGGRCVFSSEWNEYARKTYYANYGDIPFGDITKESVKQMIPPGFDVLCAGFPCQPFSIAGVSKKQSLGRETGFKDKTQGTLFFDVADIISRYRPKAFFLENVKNLCSHDKGNTFRVICETLEELDYSIHFKIMDGKAFVPQHRERILIVGFDKKRFAGKEEFQFPDLPQSANKISDILEPFVDKKYTLSDKLWGYLKDYAIRQKSKGNGFGFGLVDLDGIARTLSARYYKDGSEILIPQQNGENPRRLTPRECFRLMGYPENFIIDRVSDVQAYRQCGNSVIVPLITSVAEQLAATISTNDNL